MGTWQITSDFEIESYLEQQLKNREDAMIYNLSYIGEKCVEIARDNGSYGDITGNLRSSVGYVVAKDGVPILYSSFEQLGADSSGSTEGRAFAREKASEFPKGYSLIIVAGRDYAGYVSAKGYDVLDSAELLADKIAPKLLKNLGYK